MQTKWRTNPSFAVCIDSQSKITKDLNLNLSDMNSVICIELCDLFLKKCRFKWTFLWRLVLYLLFDCKYSIDSTCYLLQIANKQNKLFSQIFLVVVSSYLPRRIKTSSHCSRWILVPWGRVPFGQHQESRPLGRYNTRSPRFTDFPSLCASSESSLTNLIGWEYETITLRMFRKFDLPRGRDSSCWLKIARPPGRECKR